MIQKERIQYLNNRTFQHNKYIVYWMQQSQRTAYNHALEYAITQSNTYEKPLIVYFGLTHHFPDANLRHYTFMLKGLQEVEDSLEHRNIRFLLKQTSPERGIIDISNNACMVVVDRGYLKIQREWRNIAADNITCPLIQIESDVVVPVEIVSNKEEYAASTIRRKITEKLDDYLLSIKSERYRQSYVDADFNSIDLKDISKEKIDHSVKPVEQFIGGTTQALKQLDLFLKNTINNYPEKRNDPTLNSVSNMSPYLHFGHISPLYIALSVLENEGPGTETFLEELIVRRELSMNFIQYNSKYDHFDGLSEWAKKTLKKHEKDKRASIYSFEELENAETHDPYWNAAQKQMKNEGKMHGYMRMYWGKKIIEWTKNPTDAFKTAITLNNKYELDGRDPNAYAGVAWCFGKHDRPWQERPVFGTVRYMNANGLKRKFDMDLYAKKYGE